MRIILILSLAAGSLLAGCGEEGGKAFREGYVRKATERCTAEEQRRFGRTQTALHLQVCRCAMERRAASKTPVELIAESREDAGRLERAAIETCREEVGRAAPAPYPPSPATPPITPPPPPEADGSKPPA